MKLHDLPAKIARKRMAVLCAAILITKNSNRYLNRVNKVKKEICILLLLHFLIGSVIAQSTSRVFANSGVWGDYGKIVNADASPEEKGRLVNIAWKDIEISPDVWNWELFDSDIEQHVQGNLPVIFMVYTGQNAPDWLFTNGVPKVTETSYGIYTGYSPYYLDEEYNFYFKRMITKVREHVETLSASLRDNIIAVQACFGSTGDQIAYKGNVVSQYAITDVQFDSLFKVYSLCYYNEYKSLSPAIKILSNPIDYMPNEFYWLDENCPGGWIKAGTINRGVQLNMESDRYAWRYDLMNKPWSGQYMLSRSEWVGPQLLSGWWAKNPYKSMFAIMCYNICWGLDFPDETSDLFQNSKFDSSLLFFNKYAGQKIPGLATNAMCALKDVLDASDKIRFPPAIYGNVGRENIQRYENIQKAYAGYGAKLEDETVLTGNEYKSSAANGTNDVGWLLLPGNYERYLHQINANETSAGYWNVDSGHNDCMYGRFARGFDIANGKNALYFDVDDDFLRNSPLDGKYPVTIEITYYDNGTGNWQFFYDAQTDSIKASDTVSCGNTKTWLKKTITLEDAYFGNRSIQNSDFYIKSNDTNNVIFSIVELSRSAQSSAGYLTTRLASFDTVCVNSTPISQSFVLNADSLDGTNVTIGPLEGYIFSKSAGGNYTDTLTYADYGAQINATVYVNMKTDTMGVFNGGIPIRGGGVAETEMNATGTVLNTSPALNANITQISCYKLTDGAIDLQPTDGVGPFTYSWSSTLKNGWSSTNEDVYNLKAADYTVTVNAYAGCHTSQTFSIVDPGKVPKPSVINGPGYVSKNQLGVVFSVQDSSASYKYVWTVPTGAVIISGQNTATIIVNWGKANGNVTVKAQNQCGFSDVTSKYIMLSTSLVNSADNINMAFTDEQNHPATLTNPVKDIAILQFYAEGNFNYTIYISDAAGKILLIEKGTSLLGTNTKKLNVASLAAGNYFVILTNNEGRKQAMKLLKQ